MLDLLGPQFGCFGAAGGNWKGKMVSMIVSIAMEYLSFVPLPTLFLCNYHCTIHEFHLYLLHRFPDMVPIPEHEDLALLETK